MTEARWRLIAAVYDRIEAAPEAERAALLNVLCDGDADLRRDVEPLFSGERILGEQIQQAIATEAAQLAEQEMPEQSRFGNYEIVRRIGSGGMGAVYEAVRAGDFHKRVALKVIRQENDSDFARVRFQQERQVLAALEHPFIARLIDGGESAQGSPYLVMEFVDGAPLEEHAGALTREARLQLFLKVCDAVEYAHRNLVIHRDLKPANILVTSAGDPKLLDFGIAKLIEPGAEKTKTGYANLTPDYASPEQIRGLAISTAADVYSLGVILYLLLSGRKPYSLREASPSEMDRVICEEAPRPPGLGDELDHIVLMALRKEPERRYGTVQQFADDIRRYLDHLPVSARPDTIGYRTSKFVRRHSIALAGTAAFFLALAGGLGAALYEARLANIRFGDVRSLATTFLFDFDKELAVVPGNTKARLLLVTTAQKNLDKLAATAGSDESLLDDLASAYEKLGDVQGMPGISNLGMTREAADSYAKAIAILERLAGKKPKYRSRLGTDLGRLARIFGQLNDQDHATRYSADAAKLAASLSQESPGDMELLRAAARNYDLLSTMQRGSYHAEDAVDSSSKSASMYEKSIPPDAPPQAFHTVALAINRLGLALRDVTRLDEAESAFRRVSDLEGRILAGKPNDIRSRTVIANFYEDLGVLNDSYRYPNRGNTDESIAQWEKAVAQYGGLADSDPHDIPAMVNTAASRAQLALAHLRRERKRDRAAAAGLSEQAMDGLENAMRQAPGAKFPQERLPLVAWVRGLVLAHASRSSQAIETSNRGVEAARAFVRESPAAGNQIDLAGQLLGHAQVLVFCGDLAGASAASAEASAVLARINEVPRLISFAYQAGAYRVDLAEVYETGARETANPSLLREAAANYDAAIGYWSGFQTGSPYLQRRVSDLMARRDRDRRQAPR